MTREEKKLLLKDLCARLPYGIKVCARFNTGNRYTANVTAISADRDYIQIQQNDLHQYTSSSIEDIRTYLRPMSSMTEEENTIFNNISNKGKGYEEDENGWVRCDSIHTKWGVWPDGCAKLLDYLDSIHVDYRGLIQMGLALEAPEGMYKLK